jgi:hypothetical protein
MSMATLAACSLPTLPGSDEHIYTLYRDSVIEVGARIHVASFDTGEGEGYNAENCELARKLFQAQDGIMTRFWCEKGRYRP